MSDMLDDVKKTMAITGGEILIGNVDNTLSSQISTQKLFDHIELLKSNNIKERVLCVEGTKNVLSPNDECRWIPKTATEGRMVTFIYGTKLALQLPNNSMILIINSAEAQQAETKRFEQLWLSATPPETVTKTPEKTRSAS